MTEKELYQIIADELAAKKTDAALWTQAIVIAEGDADKTQAAYIRLRLADLKRTTSPQAPARAAGSYAADADSRLSQLRADLAKKLNAQGKTSLYSTLGLQPDASAAVVAAAIADLEASRQVGSNVTAAEFKYARDTLSDPALREEYDRKLLGSVSYDATVQYSSYGYDHASDSWWDSGKTTVLVGVVAVAVVGYLALGFFKERGHHEIQKATVEVQKDAVGVQRDVVQSALDVERQRIQAEAEARQHAVNMVADAQRRQLDYQMQMQQQYQERQRVADQERQKQQQQQQETMRAQREKQYWACMNQQLDVRGNTSADASARCAMYRY